MGRDVRGVRVGWERSGRCRETVSRFEGDGVNVSYIHNTWGGYKAGLKVRYEVVGNGLH